ncbi:glycosyltransferase family 4 protein [Trueperella pecoris]|uniref:Glycosyltransferase family 4 protein n=1 Tax=Trueperella pecoris TaxID=2733571 RepID=A0A7M1QWA7_9ACTO|nr:glycosyltransferase family 4 protein [Trueperella pecoris]QOR46208.1 glycosyltransferase family 4 protein [Trueperella pecoris]
MRIALIVNNYPPMVGGIEYHEENLAHGIAALGHDVWVINLAGPVGQRLDGQVRVLSGKGYLSISDIIRVPALGTTRRLAAWLRNNRIDVVSTHTRFFPMSFVGVRAAHQAGIPVIHTEHGSGYVTTKNPVIWLGSRFVDLTFGRSVLRSADKVLGVSENVVDFVRKLSGRRADVFYNAITPPSPEAVREDRPSHLIFIGRMVPGKGWDTFIDAVKILKSEGYDVEAELIGAGTQLELARAKVTEMELSDTIDVVGQVSPAEARRRLAGATLVNPTILSEGFQTTLVESIAEAGRVVTYPVPGAQMLAERGAPVAITQQRSVEELVKELRQLLAAPPTPGEAETVKDLMWPQQSATYCHICSTLKTTLQR